MRSVLLLAGLAALTVASSAGCRRPPPYRPAEELRYGAAAVVPWAVLDLVAREAAPRTWTLSLGNPFDRDVELAAPVVSGCNRCIEARWEGGTACPRGAVAIAPGQSARLQLRYSGAPTGSVGRYRLDFRLSHGDATPLGVPLTVRYDPAVPYAPRALSTRAIVGETVALAVPWRMRDGSRPASIAAWSGSTAVDAVAWAADDPGGAGQVTLASRNPWKRFQAGVVRVRREGDPSIWQVPWRCVAGSPLETLVLPASRGAASTLVLVSNVGRDTTVSLGSAETGVPPDRVIHLGPRERLHLALPRLGAEGHRDETADQLVVRMDCHDYEERISLP